MAQRGRHCGPGSIPACSGKTAWRQAAGSDQCAAAVSSCNAGLAYGDVPYVGAFFLRFIQFFDKIVALSLLPILFIAFGIDELSKIMLIVVGVAPTVILDTFNLSKGVPHEQVVKALTLGAGDFAIAYRIVFKQICRGVEQHPAELKGSDALPVCGVK